MAKVIIGKVEYTIPELNFVALEKAWPFIEESMISQDPMKGPSAGLSVIAAGLVYLDNPADFKRDKFGIPADEQLTEDEIFDFVVGYLKRALKSSEIQNIVKCMNEITEEAGLAPEEDPPVPPLEAGAENPSPETAPNTSASSSQPAVKEEAGTA